MCSGLSHLFAIYIYYKRIAQILYIHKTVVYTCSFLVFVSNTMHEYSADNTLLPRMDGR